MVETPTGLGRLLCVLPKEQTYHRQLLLPTNLFSKGNASVGELSACLGHSLSLSAKMSSFSSTLVIV